MSNATAAHELDELNIIAQWLHKHRTSEAAVRLAGRPLEEAITEALAVVPRPARRRAVAERAAERRIGPEAWPQ